jgi:radical SAM superfamily enzyme YgiQ (UPF0313 family)
MRAEVVLLNPPAAVVREPFYDQPNFPAIGIAYVASWLERHGGIVPCVIDGRLERRDPRAVVDEIVARRPRVLGISAMTHMVKTAARIAASVKAELPATKIVLGGFHASFLPERTLEEFPVFDYLVVGEGEMAFTALVRALRSGEDTPRIAGVRWRGGPMTGRGEIPPTLEELGSPAWHLFGPDAFRRHCRVLPVMSQRGCPFGCDFCSRPYGRKVRARSAQHVVDEIERNVRTLGIHDLNFFDETFTLSKRHVTAICREVIDRGLRVRWFSNLHANTADREMVELMQRAGCVEVGYGVESGNEAIIRNMQKGVTRARLLDAARVLHAVGMPFAAYFILGHPHETFATILETIRFAREIEPTRPAFGVMVPYPGTDVWDMARRGDGGYRRISEDWDEYNKQLGNAVELEGLPRRVLDLLTLVAYLYVYFPNAESEAFLASFQPDRPYAAMAARLEEHLRLVRGLGLERFTEASARNPRVRAEILDFLERSYDRLRLRSTAPSIAAMRAS